MIHGKQVGVVIPAAGQGIRFGGSTAKQFLDLLGEPLLARTLRRFEEHPAIDTIAIAGSEDGIPEIQSIVQNLHATKVGWIGLGGKYRQHSVQQALAHLETSEIILVHDAVRPFVTKTIIDSILEAVVEYGAAIPCIRPNDTIKISSGDVFVDSTPDRNSLWIAQTPQGFRKEILQTAYEQADRDGFLGTDEASLVERIGIPIKIVEGDIKNIKITTQADFLLALSLVTQTV